MVLPIIDARIHLSRSTYPWAQAQKVLRAAGVDTALVTAHPDSPRLAEDLGLPLDIATPDGPWAAYYLGGNPFAGYRRGPVRIPDNFDRYHALHIRSFLSPSLDFGAATTAALWDPERTEEALAHEGLAEIIQAAQARGMPVWLTEHFPVTLALIERFPQGRWVIPRMGAMNGGSAAVINALAENPNVYFDTALGDLHESIVRRLGHQRILFASGYPFNEPSWSLDQVGRLKLPDEEIAAIAGGNLLELLGLADR